MQQAKDLWKVTERTEHDWDLEIVTRKSAQSTSCEHNIQISQQHIYGNSDDSSNMTIAGV